jgi:hypothetical protein
MLADNSVDGAISVSTFFDKVEELMRLVGDEFQVRAQRENPQEAQRYSREAVDNFVVSLNHAEGALVLEILQDLASSTGTAEQHRAREGRLGPLLAVQMWRSSTPFPSACCERWERLRRQGSDEECCGRVVKEFCSLLNGA